MKMLDLFSGIGGFSLAAEAEGIETVAFCEVDPFCQKVLKKHWPDTPLFTDVRTLRGSDVGTVDIVAGGFPCQPFSIAGRRRGHDDPKNLWPQMLRVIHEVRPTWVVGENTAAFVPLGLDAVLADLEAEGYSWSAFVLPACSVGAPHLRNRVWVVAHTDAGHRSSEEAVCTGRTAALSGAGWPSEPNVCRVDDGLPVPVDRLESLGNAIVPQVAQEIFRAIREAEEAAQ